MSQRRLSLCVSSLNNWEEDLRGTAEIRGELRHGGSEVSCCHPVLVTLLVHLKGVPHALRAQALVHVGQRELEPVRAEHGALPSDARAALPALDDSN